MTFNLKSVSPALLACGLVVASPALASDDHDHSDILIGLDTSGDLTLLDVPDHVELDVSGAPGFNGWSGDDPGFFEIEADGLYDGIDLTQLGVANTNIQLHLISADPGFLMTDLGLNAVSPGGFTVLGVEDEGGQILVHQHVIFYIDADNPAIGPDFDGHVEATFQLVDGNGTFGSSSQFTIEFEPVPEPGSALALLAGAGLIAARRRRRG